MSDGIRIRPVRDGDWDAITALEAAAYAPSGLSEGREPLESKLRVSPSTCGVLVHGGQVAAYLFALPYPEFRWPDLAAREEAALPSRNLHLHDLAVAAHLRGRGFGRRLVRHLTERAAAQRYERVSLVAVGGSDTFWSANGFRARRHLPGADGYGPGAVYMSLALPADGTGGQTPYGRRPGGAPSRDEMG